MKQKQGGFKICAPYQMTHHEEKWQEQGRLKIMTSWRAVILDSFTSRVHSPILTVSFLCIGLDRAMSLLGPAAAFTSDLDLGPHFVYAGGLILVILQLTWACLVWLTGG